MVLPLYGDFQGCWIKRNIKEMGNMNYSPNRSDIPRCYARNEAISVDKAESGYAVEESDNVVLLN
jgi:hypothetical protein